MTEFLVKRTSCDEWVQPVEGSYQKIATEDKYEAQWFIKIATLAGLISLQQREGCKIIIDTSRAPTQLELEIYDSHRE